ncbi:MAG: hypothetical protein ACRDGD_02180 [Candidatus Limnocylindria bacterium]
MSDDPRGGDGQQLAEDGPTELVEDEQGELMERLSGGTATLLLVWLIGVGALSTLLGVWVYIWIITGERLGVGDLFGGFGFYTGLAGAAGPCVLWLAGRAQGHSYGWFLLTSAKIALTMVAIVAAVVLIAAVVLAGALPSLAAFGAGALFAVMAFVLSAIWATATWGADRWIARARVA